MCLLAVEDALSEAVARKLLTKTNIAIENVRTIAQRGNGKLKSNINKYLSAANNGKRVFMLTDLDQGVCAPSLIASWTKGKFVHERFLLRVAVREIETWLMADREALANFFGISVAKIRTDVESVLQPKEYLLQLARLAPAKIRREVLPANGALATQGFGYNQCLTTYVNEFWSCERAACTSNSLGRAIFRMKNWSSVITN